MEEWNPSTHRIWSCEGHSWSWHGDRKICPCQEPNPCRLSHIERWWEKNLPRIEPVTSSPWPGLRKFS
jgi:hypothetical protein